MLRPIKFTDMQEMEFFLNGGVMGSQQIVSPTTPNGVEGLVGRVLHVTSPVDLSVTFVAVDGRVILKFSDIKAQIDAAVAEAEGPPDIQVRSFDGRLVLIEGTPAAGVAVADANPEEGGSTANALLGFATGSATVGKVYAKGDVVQYQVTGENQHCLILDES